MKRGAEAPRPISMHSALRIASFVVALSPALTAFAQGGAGGYGQQGVGAYGQSGSFQRGAANAGALGPGGFGGGLGGAAAGPRGGRISYSAFNPAPMDARPEDDSVPDVWTSKTAILTPGDRVEYKFKMKAGETVFASVTSDAFDPALSFEDPKGKELAKNDDREEGDQSPFLIYRCEAEGTYTLKVLSFHSVSGGKFTLKFRTFIATDATLAPDLHRSLNPVMTQQETRYLFRLTAKKNRFYDLGSLYVDEHFQQAPVAFRRVIGPTGVAKNDFEVIPTADGTTVFLAKAGGDFYVEYGSPELKALGTEYRELTATAMKSKDTLKFELEPRELRIIELPVKKNEIIRTTIDDRGFSNQLSLADGDVERFDDPAFSTQGSLSWFKMNVDSNKDVVRVFHSDTTARLVIRAWGLKKDTVTVTNDDTLPTWTTGPQVKGSLEIGDCKLYLLKSTKSELMQVAAEAAHFQLKLEIVRLTGEVANVLMKRRSHTVGDNLYFPDADTFLIRISCDGNGGSGEFGIRRDTITATPYSLGTTQTLKLSGEDFGLFSVDLVAGKRYELINDLSGFLRADLLDEDGQFLTSTGLPFDKVYVQYFVPTKSGRHRLWLRGSSGNHVFKFQPNVPPALGGAK